ncbi:MAG: hypothetical protein L0H25_02605 [Micrococcales bacterium]|nr:hypothetical protein [Micrococcales bacterium]
MTAPETHALFGPLLLFAYGILDWADSIGAAGGPLWVAAQLALVASMSSFGRLALGLARRDSGETSAAALAERRAAVAMIAVAMVAVGGAGLAGAAALRLIDGPTTQVPSPLTPLASVLIGAGLLVLLRRMVVRGLLPAHALGTLGLAALILALPWDLLPLGALVTLIGLGPLTRRADPIAAPQTPEREQPASAGR